MMVSVGVYPNAVHMDPAVAAQKLNYTAQETPIVSNDGWTTIQGDQLPKRNGADLGEAFVGGSAAILLALVVGLFIRRQIRGNKNLTNSPIQTGRKWAANTAFFAALGSTHRFIKMGFTEGLVGLTISLIIFPAVAFVVGWIFRSVWPAQMTGAARGNHKIMDSGIGRSEPQRIPPRAQLQPPVFATNAMPTPIPAPLRADVLATEEDHWATAMKELETGQRRPGLWAKAFAEVDGDETKAKVAYLRVRVQQLLESQRQLKIDNEALRAEELQQLAREATFKHQALELAKQDFSTKLNYSQDQLKFLVNELDDETRKTFWSSLTGNTLLHACAESGMVGETNILLAAGANSSRQNNAGARPEDLTNNPMIRLLLTGSQTSIDLLQRMKDLKITFVDGLFCFKDFKYERLDDAIAYASKDAAL